MKEQLLVRRDIEIPEEFNIRETRLIYKGIDLLELARKYGSPLRFTYLPVITEKINGMKLYFREAIEKYNYQGKYSYYYCTKSSHFKYVVETAVKSDIGLEISSAHDIELVRFLIEKEIIPLGFKVICNGYKTPEYLKGIILLIKQGYCSLLPIVDSKSEINYYADLNINIEIGIRLNLSFLNSYMDKSRFGLSPNDIIELYENEIKHRENLSFTTLHFFNEGGISDSSTYWNVLQEVIRFYCRLKRLNSQISTLDIGGGMPFRHILGNENNIPEFVCKIICTIQDICRQECILEPDIITEFGKYTVGEATATIFKVHEKKIMEDKNWAIIDGSFITHIPDIWAVKQEYPVIPINNLESEHQPFVLGGLTCDSADYYPNSEQERFVMLPNTNDEQYLVFLHTGAYQEVLSGFGGINHCLIPSPKHILINRDVNDLLIYQVFADQHNYKKTLKILGYH